MIHVSSFMYNGIMTYLRAFRSRFFFFFFSIFFPLLFSCIVSPFFLVAGWLVGWLVGFFFFVCLVVVGWMEERKGGEMWESGMGNWERWEVGQVP